MNPLKPMLLAAALTVSLFAPAYADDTIATLRVDRGEVMTSDGGEFVTAQTGKTVVTGQRLMVTKGAAATVIYDENCTREYNAPGVYVIERDCHRAAVAWAGGTDWHAVAIITGTAVAIAAILASQDKTPCPPRSR